MKLRGPIIVGNVRNYIKVKSIITTFYNSELHVIQNITILDFRFKVDKNRRDYKINHKKKFTRIFILYTRNVLLINTFVTHSPFFLVPEFTSVHLVYELILAAIRRALSLVYHCNVCCNVM